MKSTRRDFLRFSAASGAAWVIQRNALGSPRREEGKAGAKLRILILGGTAFLGPQIVERAKSRGHVLTLFNRGKTNPHLFPDLEKLHGDRRKGDLKALEGREWDVVIDTSGYAPKEIRESAGLLKSTAKQYLFVSTISVYSELPKPGMDETAPVGTLPEGASDEKVTDQSYGPLKALCEQEAEKLFPGRTTNVRPGLIVGPGDPTDRFSYWPVRVSRGGDVLAPGDPKDPVQFIDVRDLANWIVHAVENRVFGVFNAVGPAKPYPIGDLLGACKEASRSDARFVWADAGFLEKQNVSPWGDMPVWVPPTGAEAGFSSVSCKRAIEKGLVFRPVPETVKATLEWWQAQPEDRRKALKAGIKPEREAEVLALWKKEKGLAGG